MFNKKSSKPPSRIDSLIGAGTKINGDVTFSGGLRIDGHVHGNVGATDNDKPSTLVMSEQAAVEGEIRVSFAVVNGTVVGALYAAEHVELQSKANVTGDVHYKTLEVHLGAVVQGKLVHQSGEKTDKVLAFKPAG